VPGGVPNAVATARIIAAGHPDWVRSVGALILTTPPIALSKPAYCSSGPTREYAGTSAASSPPELSPISTGLTSGIAHDLA
jgi:hypothetical protein